MIGERVHRLVYALLAALVGVPTQARWSWLLGPALLLPAVYLSLLRLRG